MGVNCTTNQNAFGESCMGMCRGHEAPKIAVRGTPTLNRLVFLWAIMHYLILVLLFEQHKREKSICPILVLHSQIPFDWKANKFIRLRGLYLAI